VSHRVQPCWQGITANSLVDFASVNSFVRRHHFFGDRWHPEHCWDDLSKTLVSRRDADSVLDAAERYPFDLQELSLETSSLIRTHCDEFSETRSRVVGSTHVSPRMPTSAQNTVPSNEKIYTCGDYGRIKLGTLFGTDAGHSYGG